MPELIKKIEGTISDNSTGVVTYVKIVSGELQQEDYINLNGLIGFLQNLTKAEQTYSLRDPLIYGLRNKNNLPITTLNIDY